MTSFSIFLFFRQTFYAAQKTCQTDDEWSECLEAMRRELPQGFRVDESSLYAPFIKKTLLEYSAKHPILQVQVATSILSFYYNSQLPNL